MRASISARGEPNDTAVDTWPWECLDCETTIYHDADFCLDCAGAYRVGERGGRRDAREGFLDWMRRESFSEYVLKVTAIAGVEEVLTAVWLQVLLGGSAPLDLVARALA